VDTDSHSGGRLRLPLLEIKGLTKRFPGVTALDAVDLSLAPGEIHALVGENGAGKSTLIKLLCGSYIPDAGEMQFCGAPYTPQSPLDALEAGIRVVYQEFNLLPYLSVAENLLFDCLPRRYGILLDYRTLHKRATTLLKQVGLDVDPHTSVEHLGIAQRQLLEIGKALSSASRLLILDEPTATLTLREIRRLFEIIRDVRASGVTVIFVSHHLNEIFDLCDAVTVLRNGRRIASLPVVATNPPEIVHLMVGRELEAALAVGRTAEEPSRGPAAIRVQELRFRGNAHGISFALQYGEILGFAGLVGSGRTEMLRAIFGADQRDGGEIYRDEQRVRFDRPRDAVRHGVCLLTENRKEEGLVLPMPVRVNVTLAPSLAAAVGASPLFVFVRDPAHPGPPLAVKRLESRFPQVVSLAASDAMIPGRAFAPGQSVQVVARIARSGNPVGASGDPLGEVTYQVGRDGLVSLVIDHLMP